MSTQAERVVARGFSLIMWRFRGAREVMIEACCSSRVHMKMPSIPSSTFSPLLSLVRLSFSYCRKSFQSANS